MSGLDKQISEIKVPELNDSLSTALISNKQKDKSIILIKKGGSKESYLNKRKQILEQRDLRLSIHQKISQSKYQN